MELILVRHAKAFERDPLRWPDDAQRPLTVAGARDFDQMAKRLRRLVPRVDRVESSGFVRAWATACVLGELGGWPRPRAAKYLEPRASDAAVGGETLGPEQITALSGAVAALRALGTVAWVGHEPMLSAMASVFLAGRPDALAIDFRKGAALAVAFDSLTDDPRSAVGGARLQWMISPRVARRLRKQ